MSYIIFAVAALAVLSFVYTQTVGQKKWQRYWGFDRDDSVAGAWVGTFDNDISLGHRAGVAAAGLLVGGIATVRTRGVNVALSRRGILSFILELEDGVKKFRVPRQAVRIEQVATGKRVNGQKADALKFTLPDGLQFQALLPSAGLHRLDVR